MIKGPQKMSDKRSINKCSKCKNLIKPGNERYCILCNDEEEKTIYCEKCYETKEVDTRNIVNFLSTWVCFLDDLRQQKHCKTCTDLLNTVNTIEFKTSKDFVNNVNTI